MSKYHVGHLRLPAQSLCNPDVDTVIVLISRTHGHRLSLTNPKDLLTRAKQQAARCCQLKIREFLSVL